jgi:hypothetical protein
VHFSGWDHYTEGAESLRAAFADERLGDRLEILERGQRVVWDRVRAERVPRW